MKLLLRQHFACHSDSLSLTVPATTSSAIPAMFNTVLGIFSACTNGAATAPVGCNAGPTSLLVANLKSFGLPITDAYYNQQNA